MRGRGFLFVTQNVDDRPAIIDRDFVKHNVHSTLPLILTVESRSTRRRCCPWKANADVAQSLTAARVRRTCILLTHLFSFLPRDDMRGGKMDFNKCHNATQITTVYSLGHVGSLCDLYFAMIN